MGKASQRNRQQTAVTPSSSEASRKRQRASQQAMPLQRIGLIAFFTVLALGGFAFAALSTGSRAKSANHASSSSGEQAGSPSALASLTSSSTGALPTLVAAREGDINAKYRQVVKTARSNGNVTLTIRDNDMLHKDHWDISDAKGNKTREVDFDGNEIWPNGPNNKNKW